MSFIIFNPSWPIPPTKWFDTAEEAAKVAATLALQQPHHHFFIMEMVGHLGWNKDGHQYERVTDASGVPFCPMCRRSEGKRGVALGNLLQLVWSPTSAPSAPHFLPVAEWCATCSLVVLDFLKERAGVK